MRITTPIAILPLAACAAEVPSPSYSAARTTPVPGQAPAAVPEGGEAWRMGPSTLHLWSATFKHSPSSGDSTCLVSAIGKPLYLGMLRSVSGTRETWVSAYSEYGLYPGRDNVYLTIDGQRFAGEEIIVMTPALERALRSGEIAYLGWSPWPEGGQEEARVRLRVSQRASQRTQTAGASHSFAAAWDQCQRELADE